MLSIAQAVRNLAVLPTQNLSLKHRGQPVQNPGVL